MQTGKAISRLGVDDLPTAADATYRRARRTIARLVRQAPDPDRTPVPACPGWTVRDLVEHVVAIGWKVAVRNGMIVGPEPERGAPVAELVGQWADIGPAVDVVIAQRPTRRSLVLVMDALTHEADIRVALGVPPPTSSTAAREIPDLLVDGFRRELRRRRLPALRIVTDGRRWTVGSGVPDTVLRAGWYDLHRSLAGRRTVDQIAALDWSGPAARWLPAFEWGPFHPPAHQVEDVGTDEVRAA